MLFSPAPAARASLGELTNMSVTPAAPRSAKTPTSNRGSILKTPSSKQPPSNTQAPSTASAWSTHKPTSRGKKVGTSVTLVVPTNETVIFDCAGVLEPTRGPAPPCASPFGVSGILESERGPTPLAHKGEGRRAAAERTEYDAAVIEEFLASHPDAERRGNRVLCTKTGHEMPPSIEILVSHWGGKKYRQATRSAACSPALQPSGARLTAAGASGKALKRSKVATTPASTPAASAQANAPIVTPRASTSERSRGQPTPMKTPSTSYLAAALIDAMAALTPAHIDAKSPVAMAGTSPTYAQVVAATPSDAETPGAEMRRVPMGMFAAPRGGIGVTDLVSEIESMKAAELRHALASLGLVAQGARPALIARLVTALTPYKTVASTPASTAGMAAGETPVSRALYMAIATPAPTVPESHAPATDSEPRPRAAPTPRSTRSTRNQAIAASSTRAAEAVSRSTPTPEAALVPTTLEPRSIRATRSMHRQQAAVATVPDIEAVVRTKTEPQSSRVTRGSTRREADAQHEGAKHEDAQHVELMAPPSASTRGARGRLGSTPSVASTRLRSTRL